MYKKRGLSFITAMLMLLLLLSGCGSDPSSSAPIITPPPSSSTSSQTPSSTQNTTAGVSSTTASTPASTTTVTPPSIPSAANETAASIVQLAYDLLGTTFKFGGIGPDEFDNSGFVYYCYQQHGINIPRLAKGMATAGQTLTRDQMLPGDIAVFCNNIEGDDAYTPAFVGIYVGEGKFIACNNPTTPTKVQNMNTTYWKARFLSGRRVV